MMKRIVWWGFMLLICFLVELSQADDAEFRLVVSRNDMAVGGEFHADLEMQITSGTSPRTLNSLTVDVYYGPELSQWSADPATGWAYGSADGYTRSANKLSGYYRILTTGGAVNENSATQPPGSPSGWDVTTSWKKIVALRWTIALATSVNVSIADDSDAAAYFVNYTNAPQGTVTGWTVSNQDLGDVSLPAQLTSFTAESVRGQVVLKWQTQSEVDNLGFNILRSESYDAHYEKINAEIINGAGNSTSPADYSFVDDRVQADHTYYYQLEDIDIRGNASYHGPISVFVEAVVLPENFSLEQNYPNPFNPTTILSYAVPVQSHVVLRIFNTRGEAVRTLVNADQPGDFYTVTWDGNSDGGRRLPSGIYFCKIEAGSYSEIRKMALAK